MINILKGSDTIRNNGNVSDTVNNLDVCRASGIAFSADPGRRDSNKRLTWHTMPVPIGGRGFHFVRRGLNDVRSSVVGAVGGADGCSSGSGGTRNDGRAGVFRTCEFGNDHDERYKRIVWEVQGCVADVFH